MKKKFLVAIVVIGILIPIATAILDPIIYHTSHKDMVSNTGMYRIDSDILGKNIVDIELIENSKNCFRNCYAVFRIHPYETLSTNTKDYDMYWKTELSNNYINFNNYKFKIRTTVVEQYTYQTCKTYNKYFPINGTPTCKTWQNNLGEISYYKWIPFDFYNYNFPINQDTYVKLEGTKAPFQSIEWIPKFYGYELDEWAWWNTSYNWRRNITSQTTVNISMALNGTGRFYGKVIWFNPSEATKEGIYYNNSAIYAIGNDSRELNYYTELGTGGDYNASLVHGAGAYGIWHYNNSMENNGTGADGACDGNCPPTYISNGIYGHGIGVDTDIKRGHDLNAGDTTELLLGNKTMVLFFRCSNILASGHVFTNHDGAKPWTRAYTLNETRFTFQHQNSSGNNHYVIMDVSNMSDNNTHMIVIQSNETGADRTISLFYDGAFQNSTGTVDDTDTNYQMCVGRDCRNDGFSFCNGTFDELRWYTRRLTSTEIEALWNNSQNLNNLLDVQESQGGVFLTKIKNVTNITYKNSQLKPDIWAFAGANFNVSLILYSNVTDTINYTLLTTTQLGGVNYTNYSIEINTSVYNDSWYYLNLSAVGAGGSDESKSSVFAIDNTAPDITYSGNFLTGWFNDLNHTINFTLIDKIDLNITCNISFNNNSWYQNYTNNTQYNPYADIYYGLNNVSIFCEDDAGHNASETDSFNASYTKINVRDEESRGIFGIENYTARMFVTLADQSNVTYENSNASQMTGWYFFALNDTIKDVRLAIETVYYRSQTDLQDLTNVTFFMYNASNLSNSQVLFKINNIGYDKPLVLMRPRETGEDLITAEYPIGSDREVNAYLIDSRLYNIYSYDSNNNLRFESNLMVSGARIIYITVGAAADSYIDRSSYYAHFVADKINETTNYTLIATGCCGSFTIDIMNWTGGTFASGSYSGEGILTLELNKSNLNETNFIAVFNYSDGNLLRRTLSLGSPVLVFPSLGWLNIGSGTKILYGIFALIISIGVAGVFSKLDMGIGLIIGAGILALTTWAAELPGIFGTVALIMGIAGGAAILLKMRG